MRKRIRLDESGPTVYTIAGISREPGYADGPIADAKFRDPAGVAVDASGNFFVADSENSCIRKVAPDGKVSTVAGGGTQNGYANGSAVNARFSGPYDVAVAVDGTVFVADSNNHCIRKIAPDGHVSTFAGVGVESGYVDGPAGSARFNCPNSVAVSVDGFVIVADTGNHCIRKVTPDGKVSTMAGGGEEEGYTDGPVVDARFSGPSDVAIDADGTVIVADSDNNCIRKIAPDGHVSTLAGGGGCCESGHVDGPAGSARFLNPCGVDMDADGIVIVADEGNHCLRMVTPDGHVSTLAGRGGEDGRIDGPAATARFHAPVSVVVDADGAVIVAEYGGHCIRKVKQCSLSRGATIHRWPLPQSTLAADWSRLLADGTFADVTFAVAGVQVRAHRAVLAARSSYFHAMLHSGCREAQPGAVVVVPDVSEEAFRALLAYVYSDRLELNDQSVMDVMCKAHQYGMLPLYIHCMRYVVHHISKDNVVAWLIAAEAHNLEESLKFSLRFAATHLRGIRKGDSDQFAGLQDHPRLMMRILQAI